MRCMLDADTCVLLIQRDPRIHPQAALNDCILSTIVLGELEYAVADSSPGLREQNKLALLDFVSATRVLRVTDSVSEKYGEIRAQLKDQPIGPNNLWIAAHALSLDVPLITNNKTAFNGVPNLRIDSWLA